MGRILAEKDDDPVGAAPADDPFPAGCDSIPSRTVVARRPDHIWHVDMTIIPTAAGMWTAWYPFAQLQVWPFCWWVAAVLDHYSRGVVALKVFRRPPGSSEICAVLDQAISRSRAMPRYIITDKGSQFWCRTYKSCCRRRGIRPRFEAVGRYGSIAVIERFIRSLKSECTRALLVPFQEDAISRELELYARWHNRPNQALGGLTPAERRQAGKSEPGASCGNKPQETEDGTLKLSVSFLENRRHLPIVKLQRAA